MGLIVVKDSVVEVERYQYDRKRSDRFVSQSMAKSITSLAVGFALWKAASTRWTIARINTRRHCATRSTAARRSATFCAWRPAYAISSATITPATTTRFAIAVSRVGGESACWVRYTERDSKQGSHFNYAGPHTVALAAVLRGATGMSLAQYTDAAAVAGDRRRAVGAWIADRTGLEVAQGSFNATLGGYARLGIVLANDGRRPDDGKQVVPRDYIDGDATDWKSAPPQLPSRARPPRSSATAISSGCTPASARRFVMLGVSGHSMFVDPR